MQQFSKILRRWSSARSVGEPQDVAEIDAIIEIDPEDAQIFCSLAARVITPPRQMGKKFVVSGDELSTLYVELALSPLSRSTILGDQKSGIFKAFMQVKKEAARISRSKKNDLSCERFKTHSNYSARVVACCASLRTIVPECARFVNVDHWNDLARQGMQVVHPDGTGHAATSNYIRRGAPFFLQLLELMCSTIDRAFSTETDRASSKARVCTTWINASYLSTFNWGNNKYRELLPSSKWQNRTTDFRAFHDRICELLSIRDLDTLYDEVSEIVKDNTDQLWRFTENVEAWQYWKEEVREHKQPSEFVMEVDSGSSDEEMAPPPSLCLNQFQQPVLPSYTPRLFDFPSSSNEFMADDDERVPPSAHLALWNTPGVIDQGGYAIAPPFIPAPGGNSTSSNASHQSIGLISICSNLNIPPFQYPEQTNDQVRGSVEETKDECRLYVNSGITIADDCNFESDFDFDDRHFRSAPSCSAPQMYQPQMYQPQMFVPEMVYPGEPIPCHRRRSLSFERRRMECPISYCNEQDMTLSHLLENHLDVIGGQLSSWDEEWIQTYVVKLFHDAVANHEEISRPLLEATRQQFEYFVPPDIVQLKQEILACIDALERRCV